MIELRWLYDSRSDAHRVLQFREGGYDLTDRKTGEDVWRGTTWTNVAEVRESPQSRKD